ncbi:MAG: 16S rRNA (cytidine(1402)-2'-O)-methyltransferase [Bacilli bacterium]|nr:16S rRNA (cytidine(1402)-2'-O)-methyltransferase [Bacilli bacterium]
MSQISYNDTPSLYLIPTPIGNLDDITIRSLNTLKTVDLILCEDTRESGKLLSKYDIKKKLVACHEFNQDKVKGYVVDELNKGLNIGLITDQGTPIISDPGFTVVKEVIDKGFNVISLPGATAFVPALINSGLNPAPFLFYGFLNAKSSKQRKELENLKKLPYTMIFYEAPHRLSDTLNNMLNVFGDRDVCLQREISKIHEEIYRDKLSNIVKNIDNFKGEFVILVSGCDDVFDFSDLSIIEHVDLYLKDGMSLNEATKIVAKERNVSKSIIYKEYHLGK